MLSEQDKTAIKSRAAECKLTYETEYQRELDVIYSFKENHSNKYYLAWLSGSIDPQPVPKDAVEAVGQARRKLGAQW